MTEVEIETERGERGVTEGERGMTGRGGRGREEWEREGWMRKRGGEQGGGERGRTGGQRER